MNAPIYTYSATELAELARLADAERAAHAAWAHASHGQAYTDWLAASKALSDYAMSLSTINP